MMYAKGEYVRAFHEVVKIAPVTLPKLNLGDLDVEAIEAEARQAATKVKTIRAGRDAWEAINKAQSFEGWKAIGAALAVGKAHALRVTGANAAWGRNYSREFNLWVRQHGFDKMPAATGASPSSSTSTPRRSPHGGTHYRSASASGSFTRYRSHVAGEPLQPTTASAPKTYGGTPRPRGRVSAPVRRHCRRMRRGHYGNS